MINRKTAKPQPLAGQRHANFLACQNKCLSAYRHFYPKEAHPRLLQIGHDLNIPTTMNAVGWRTSFLPNALLLTCPRASSMTARIFGFMNSQR